MAGLVPAISLQEGAALVSIGITGTRPVMTETEAPIQHRSWSFTDTQP
jgi:hypothetical protein